MDNFILVVWIFYQSTFFKVGYSAIDVESFNSVAECEIAATIVKSKISMKHRPDDYSITCTRT